MYEDNRPIGDRIEDVIDRQLSEYDEPTVREKFFEPLMHALGNASETKPDCPRLSDEEYLKLGCDRVVSESRSGRDFLQNRYEVADNALPRATFFNSLSSERRLRLVRECSFEVFCRGTNWLDGHGRDFLDMIPELKDRPVFAADGHQVKHASHALRDPKGRLVPPKSLYVLCLHSALLYNLAPVQGDGSYAHEMPVFRRRMPRFLTGLSEKRKKSGPSIWVVDAAYVDNDFWEELRLLGYYGGRFVMPLKDNMNPASYEDIPFDREAEINQGVLGFQEVCFEDGTVMRLIDYQDPETGKRYRFLTTIDDLSPGAIAFLYRLRWRIEKVYDTFKNQLFETKQWTATPVGREIHAHFVALAYNLLTLFRDFLELEHGIREEKLETKRQRYLDTRQSEAAQHGREVHPLDFATATVVQLSAQFIRCLRNYLLLRQVLLSRSIDVFAQRMYIYL